MWNRLFAARLHQEIDTWVARGWVSIEGAGQIRAGHPVSKTIGAAPLLLLAGSFLVIVGIITVVSANWDAFAHLTRLLFLAAGIVIAAAAGGWARLKSTLPGLAEAFFLIAVGMFGASIFLVAQMYNINAGNIPAAIFVWWLGALALAWGAQARASLVAAFVIGVIWLFVKEAGPDFVAADGVGVFSFFPFLIPWALGVAASVVWKWRIGLHAAAVAFLVFLIHITSAIPGILYYESGAVLSLFALMLLFAAHAAPSFIKEGASFLRPFLQTAQTYTLIFTLYAYTVFSMMLLLLADIGSDIGGRPGGTTEGLWLLSLLSLATGGVLLWARGRVFAQATLVDIGIVAGVLLSLWVGPYVFVEPYTSSAFWVLSAFTLGFALWLGGVGDRHNIRWVMWVGYALFILHVLRIYAQAFSSILDTGLFLIGGGVLLIGSVYGSHKLSQQARGDAA